jgi:hypothetical protein
MEIKWVNVNEALESISEVESTSVGKSLFNRAASNCKEEEIQGRLVHMAYI